VPEDVWPEFKAMSRHNVSWKEAQCHNLRAPLRPTSAASHGSMVMWQASRRGINTRIDQHLDLVTTILARPEMTDFVLAHVLRPLRRNHQLITFSARHSVARAINDPSGRHEPPLLFVSLWRGELNAL
jgi:hypothetical protein